MLSGEVKIRDQHIVKWEAKNLGNGLVPGTNIYLVKANGYHTGRKFDFRFEVTHFRNTGPFILACLVMTEIDILMQDLEES